MQVSCHNHCSAIAFSLLQTHFNLFHFFFAFCSCFYHVSGERIRQLGLSRSNLTIKMATEFLKSVAYINTRSIIFNVGSVDIIRGASVADMKRNYIEMIGVCRNRNVHPIITTLAPIGNVNFSNHIQRKIVEMNNFLIEHFGSNVIDLWSLMVNSTGRMKSEFFKR